MAGRKKDDLGETPLWISRFGWLIAIISLALFGLAQPDSVGMFDRMMGTGRVAAQWDLGQLRAAIGLDILASLTALVALVLNSGRKGREQEQLMSGLLIFLCAVGLLVMIPLARGS